jgi:Family of unknown function (DUF6516)
LNYSFTLHDPDGARLVGFDNAHSVPAKGARFRRRAVKQDHWHRSGDDPGRPYTFTTADQLLADFFTEVKSVLSARGIGEAVIGESETTKRKKP